MSNENESWFEKKKHLEKNDVKTIDSTDGGFRRRRRESSMPLPMPQLADRLPPHSIEAEQGILGCMLLDGSCINLAVEKIQKGSEVFYDLRHQALFDALVELREKKNLVDMITVQQFLKDKNQLEALGGMPYLSGLMNVPPSAANIEYYIEIVLEKFTLRKIIKVCTGSVASIYDSQANVKELIDEVARNLSDACADVSAKKSKTIAALINHAIETIEKAHNSQGQTMGLATGFPDLDKMTGGLLDADLIVIAARPSHGKTSLAMNIAEHVAIECKLPVGVFSLEMSAESLSLRMLCSRARVNLRNIMDGFLAERDFPKITGAAGKISNAPIHIDDSASLNIMQLKARARGMFQQHGIKLLVIDYLQLVKHIGRVENRQQQIGQVVTGLKELAKELNIPIIVLAQLNRELDKESKKRKPRLSDLRESGDIEQAGDVIGLLYQAKTSEDEEENGNQSEAVAMNLLIAKQRNGPTGDVHLTFLKSITRYESASKVSDVPSEEPRMFE